MATPVVGPVTDRWHGVDWSWAAFFTEDPRAWVLGGSEPAAHGVLLTGVIDLPPDGFQAATTRSEVVVDPLDDLAPRALAVDVIGLTSSKGGTGHALPPPRRSA